MKLKDAAIRASRAAVWAFAGALGAAPTIEALANGPRQVLIDTAWKWAFAAIAAGYAFVIAFAINVGEDNTNMRLPK